MSLFNQPGNNLKLKGGIEKLTQFVQDEKQEKQPHVVPHAVDSIRLFPNFFHYILKQIT